MATNNAQLSQQSQVLSYNQIKALWIANGGSPAWAPLMAGIAIAESGGNTQAINSNAATGDYSVGLWQINYFQNLGPSRTAEYGSPTALTQDPNLQAKAAIDLLGNNGAGIGNWTNDATWKKWVAAGSPNAPSDAMVMGWLGITNGGSTAAATPGDAAQAGASATTTGFNPLDPLGIGGAVSSTVLGSLSDFLGIPHINWTAVAGMLIAIGLIGAGIYIMFHTQINDAVGGAVKDARAGAAVAAA